MNKKMFLSKSNKYNIPGYTDVEFEAAYKKDYPEDSNYTHICKCPICEHNYIYDCGCKICGYDDFLFFDSPDEEESKIKFKEKYIERTKLIENYVWKFDRNKV